MVSGLHVNLEGTKFAAMNRTLNKWAIDKIITHICALALAIDNCEVDMHDLREDLKLDNKE